MQYAFFICVALVLKMQSWYYHNAISDLSDREKHNAHNSSQLFKNQVIKLNRKKLLYYLATSCAGVANIN